MVDMKMNVGIVTLEEIKDSVFSMCNDRKDDELSFLDFTRCIQELHKKKLGENYSANALGDSYAGTAFELSKINYSHLNKVEQHFIESMLNLYNTIVYSLTLLTIKKTNNNDLISSAERDFRPLIKKHWDQFVQLTFESS